MLSYKTLLSLNGQSPIECLPITANSSVSLCETGVTSFDLASVNLQLNEHDELVVVKIAEKPVVLERAGRKMQLRIGKPIRISENDTLWFENSSISIVKSTCFFDKHECKSTFTQNVRKVIAASAAVFSMASFNACDVDVDETSGTDMPQDLCEANAMKCEDNKVMECVDGSWSVKESCEGNASCIQNSNTSAVCKES